MLSKRAIREQEKVLEKQNLTAKFKMLIDASCSALSLPHPGSDGTWNVGLEPRAPARSLPNRNGTSFPLVNLVTESSSSPSQSCRPDLSRLSQAAFIVHPGYSPRLRVPAPPLLRHCGLLTCHTCGASDAASTALAGTPELPPRV